MSVNSTSHLLRDYIQSYSSADEQESGDATETTSSNLLGVYLGQCLRSSNALFAGICRLEIIYIALPSLLALIISIVLCRGNSILFYSVMSLAFIGLSLFLTIVIYRFLRQDNILAADSELSSSLQSQSNSSAINTEPIEMVLDFAPAIFSSNVDPESTSTNRREDVRTEDVVGNIAPITVSTEHLIPAVNFDSKVSSFAVAMKENRFPELNRFSQEFVHKMARKSLQIIVPVSKRGFLKKLGHVRRNWKRRYFVLEKGMLIYYQDKYEKDEKGRFSLEGYSLSTSLSSSSQARAETTGVSTFLSSALTFAPENSGTRLYLQAAETPIASSMSSLRFSLFNSNGDSEKIETNKAGMNFVIEAETTEERDDWAAALNRHIIYLQALKTPI